MGSDALQLNTEGESNSGFGAYSLARNTLGNYNSASGSYALNLNETGNENTAEGYEAVFSNTTGNQNTGTGFEALYSSETGNNNAAIGYKSLFTNVTGSNNTAIGSDADVSSGALSNSTAIGNGATVGASNKIRLGNSSVTVIEGQVAYTFPSDARFKYNVKENVPGLTFIRNLKPVTYQFDTKKYDAHLMQNMVDSVREKRMKNVDYNSSSSIIHTGFLAQDIEKICKDLGIDFDGLHTPDANNNTDHYSLAYSQFIMPLVKAVQEQQSTIDSLNLSNKTLQTDLNTLKVEVEAIKASISQK